MVQKGARAVLRNSLSLMASRFELRMVHNVQVLSRSDRRLWFLSVIHSDRLADTKRERIEATKDFALLASRHRTDPVAELLLKSYHAAITDASKELAHLYDIREVLATKFGGETKARAVLGITKSRWGRLGELANDVPLSQGRHRGRKIGQLRDANPSELDEARAIAKDMIRKYLQYL